MQGSTSAMCFHPGTPWRLEDQHPRMTSSSSRSPLFFRGIHHGFHQDRHFYTRRLRSMRRRWLPHLQKESLVAIQDTMRSPPMTVARTGVRCVASLPVNLNDQVNKFHKWVVFLNFLQTKKHDDLMWIFKDPLHSLVEELETEHLSICFWENVFVFWISVFDVPMFLFCRNVFSSVAFCCVIESTNPLPFLAPGPPKKSCLRFIDFTAWVHGMN